MVVIINVNTRNSYTVTTTARISSKAHAHNIVSLTRVCIRIKLSKMYDVLMIVIYELLLVL